MNWMAENDYAAPAGMVALRLGDVVVVDGARCIATMVNDCRARMEPLDRKRVSRETRFGDKVEFDAQGRSCNVSVHVEPSDVVERRSAAGVAEFLAARKARGRKAANGLAQTKNNNNGEGKETEMRTRKTRTVTDKTKARGGLAAEMAEDSAASKRGRNPNAAGKVSLDGPRSKGKLGELMGFSVVSVIRTLAKAGTGTAHVKAIMEARGVAVKPATVQIQCGAGRSGSFGGKRVSYAPITKEQVADLLVSVPDPKAAIAKE